MSLQQKQAVFALNIAKLIYHINEQGLSCTFGDAFRSPEQAELNASKGIGIKDSLHCKRLAIDLNLFDKNSKYMSSGSPEYIAIGTFWKSLYTYNRFGGDFARKDWNHFEMQDI